MVDLASFEPVEVPAGTRATVLVSQKVGPSVCIPLHSLPDRAAHDLLVHFAGESELTRMWWDVMKSVEPFGRLVYVVGEATARAMLETMDGAWPDGVEVWYLHG